MHITCCEAKSQVIENRDALLVATFGFIRLNHRMPVGASEAMIAKHYYPARHYVKHFCSHLGIHELIIGVKHGIIHVDQT